MAQSEFNKPGPLNYRNSPAAKLLFSPSQMLNSRIMRSKLPISIKNLKSNLVPENVYEDMTKKNTMISMQGEL